jgi:hypothetical protein
MNLVKLNHDSRRFPTSRLLSIHGYDHLPLVNDTLRFDLPRFRQHSGRLVAVGQRVWELWSPNSAQVAFYPGVPPTNFQLSPPSDERQRRYDGHLGRYDYTVSPQLLSEERPWRGFILRQEVGFKQQLDYPEFALLHQNWHSTSPEAGMIAKGWIDGLMFRLNHLDAEMSSCSELIDCRADLWGSRPLYPSVDDVVSLRCIQSFAVAVDHIAWLQRGIKDRAAWLIMARLVLADPVTLDMIRKGTIPPACEDYIGAWINGSDERDAIWAMGKGMPCFVIHEFTPAERGMYSTAPRSTDFLHGTDPLLLQPSQNGFDYIALRSGAVPTTSPALPQTPHLRLFPHDRKLSAAPAQGWTGVRVGVTMPTPTAESLVPTLPLLKDDEEGDDVQALKKFNPANPRYAAPPLEYAVLDPCRVPWLKPPPVQSVPPGRKWSKWIFDTSSAGNPVVKSVGKKANHKRFVYYDRENFRELSSSKPIEQPAGLTSDPKVFGLPAPMVLYAEKHDRGWRQHKASWWMYPTRIPEKVGMTAPPPQLTSLAMHAGPSPVHDQSITHGGLLQDTTSQGGMKDLKDEFLPDFSRPVASDCSNVPLARLSSEGDTATAHVMVKDHGNVGSPAERLVASLFLHTVLTASMLQVSPLSRDASTPTIEPWHKCWS